MPVKKSTKKKAVKSSAPVKKGNKKAGPSSAAAKNNGRGPFYVLTIMVLLALLALFAERFYDTMLHDEKEKPSVVHTEKEPPEKPEKIKKDDYEKAPEKKDEEIETVKPPVTKPDKRVRVYFIKYDEQTNQVVLAPVSRQVNPVTYLEDTIRSLLEGPTPAEGNRGYLTAIDPDSRVRKVTVKNGLAEIDFNSSIETGGGVDNILNRLDQIVYTATQFSEVDAVRIKINGEHRSTFGSDGISISSPLRKN